MNSTADSLFPDKPEARLRIHAWVPVHPSPEYQGLIKVGQTSNPDVNVRIRQSQGQHRVQYTLLLDEVAERNDGTSFTDNDIRTVLVGRGIENPNIEGSREWYRCTIADVKSAINELRTGERLEPGRHQTFPMRPEQAKAVRLTDAYFKSVWAEDKNAIPRFLWNAKMRFGKTFATYELAKKIGAQRVLVVTFKPAVEGAWRDDLLEHVDFEGWQFGSRRYGLDPDTADKDRPLVYFGSFQDLLGRDKAGNIKANNEWLHTTNWDLVVFDEYHFGAWRENAKELFEGEDQTELTKELKELGAQASSVQNAFEESFEELAEDETEFLPITTRAYLYLSGTPFRALSTGEFTEEQIFNWTYTDEQKAKRNWAKQHQGSGAASANPYQALPEMRLMTYQMPDELIAIAKKGEFDEFDLNEFFTATGTGANAVFKHKEYVQKWLDIIRGAYAATQVDNLRLGASKPPFPYSDVRLRPYLNHSVWFLPNVAACYAMANLLTERQNVFYHDYEVLTVAGVGAGVGLEALPPVRRAIKSGNDSKTITLTCGKLTTGVTVAQWSSILMLRNLKSPETYFQAAFRVQSPWSIRNPDGDNPNREDVLKPVCFVFDFAPTRALTQLAEYGQRLNPEAKNPETAVEELVNFLPVLAYDGSSMKQIDAAGVLDWAMSGTTATMLARRWESAILVNVDNDTLRKIMNDPRAMAAVMNIEGFRALGSDVIETVINKSETVKETKRERGDSLDPKEKKELTEEEKEYKSKRKQIQEKLIKFATRIPAFMYLTDFRENTLKDVITKLDSELFKKVTGITKEDFNLLVSLGVFNSTLMNQAVFQFRRYEDASLSYTGIESHPNLRHVGLYDTVITTEEVAPTHGERV